MGHTKYLIVGGGVAGASAIDGIRAYDPDGAILMLSRENHAPYRRPLLSQELLHGGAPSDDLSLHDPEYYRERGVELLLRRDVVELVPEEKSVWDDRGAAYSYDRLLLATGVKPRALDIAGADHPELHYFASLEDYLLLLKRIPHVQHVLVIGDDILALQLATGLRHHERQVTLVCGHDHPLPLLLPRDLGGIVADGCRELQIELVTNEAIVAIEDQGGLIVARTRDGNLITTQTAIVSVGADPQVELAEAAGLEIGNGIEVDEMCRTSAADVYAAGDATEYPDLALGRRARLEAWDHAVHHGRAAGANMAGAGLPYTHIPARSGRILDVTFEAVGDTDPTFETQVVWREPQREGVVFYAHEDVVRGVLLWNLAGRVEWARELIRERRATTREQRESLIPDLVGADGSARAASPGRGAPVDPARP